MAETTQMRTGDRGRSVPPPEPSGWTVGWTMFAAVMLMLAGGLQATYGLVALLNDEWVVWTNRADLYLDLTTWGWVHLLGGIVVVLAGVGVLTGNLAARIVAVLIASLSLIANFLFIPAYPLWSIIVVTMNVIVIWALTAHGSEMKTWAGRSDYDLT